MKHELTDMFHHLRIRIRLSQQINYIPYILNVIE